MENKKYTVVTGASSGIGYATAQAFARRNKNLILIARRRELLEKLKEEILTAHPQTDVVIRTADLSEIKNVYQVYDELKQYFIETWINNAGFGNYSSVATQNLQKVETMLRLNVEALTVFSSLYVRNFCNIEGTQLINISSAGGYTMVPNAVTYCATKFYVSTFTEGLARELIENGCCMRAKVLAPAATKTEFGEIANDVDEYDYDKQFGSYHTSAEMASFLLQLYDSDRTVGHINRENFQFNLSDPQFSYAGNSKHNQKM